ncbi:hypothetical protein Tco_1375839 [Tanacetum coccineum]
MDALNFIVDLLHGDQSVIVAVRDVDDVFNSVATGLGTGALFKAAINVRFASLAVSHLLHGDRVPWRRQDCYRKGAIEGVRDFKARDTMKLMDNMILNEGELYGRMIENRAGIIGFLVAGMVSEMVAVRDVDDVFNSVVAGLGTRALFKAANWVRSAALAGATSGIEFGIVVAGNMF